MNQNVIFQFNSVLKKQHLADPLLCFLDHNICDEVPLYSRYKQVDFLKSYGDVNLLLIELALAYLNRVAFEIQIPRVKRFLAITVIDEDDGEYIVPAIFVCNSKVKTRLKKLHLSTPSEGLGQKIKTLVKKAKLDARFTVLEDCDTVPDDKRIFISYESPPHGLVNISNFILK